MRIDMKRDAEMQKRKGLANRTVFAVIAVIVGFFVSFLVTGYLFTNEIITVNFFYNQLFVPSTVSEELIRVGLSIVMVIGIQFFAIIAFAIASPEARERPGTPTAKAQDPDYYEAYSYTD